YEPGSTLSLAAGQTIRCVFTNTKAGRLIVDKITNPSGDPTSFAFTTTGSGYAGFSLTDTAAPNDQALASGTYAVAETSTTGWTLTSAMCDNVAYVPGSNLTLAAGQTIQCVFTNTKASHLVVDKVTNPSGDATSFAFTTTGAGYAG